MNEFIPILTISETTGIKYIELLRFIDKNQISCVKVLDVFCVNIEEFMTMFK